MAQRRGERVRLRAGLLGMVLATVLLAFLLALAARASCSRVVATGGPDARTICHACRVMRLIDAFLSTVRKPLPKGGQTLARFAAAIWLLLSVFQLQLTNPLLLSLQRFPNDWLAFLLSLALPHPQNAWRCRP